MCKGLFAPSGSGSEDSIDLYLYHSDQASAAAASLASKDQMGSGPIFPVMLLPLYWVSFDLSRRFYVFYYLQMSSAFK